MSGQVAMGYNVMQVGTRKFLPISDFWPYVG